MCTAPVLKQVAVAGDRGSGRGFLGSGGRRRGGCAAGHIVSCIRHSDVGRPLGSCTHGDKASAERWMARPVLAVQPIQSAVVASDVVAALNSGRLALRARAFRSHFSSQVALPRQKVFVQGNDVHSISSICIWHSGWAQPRRSTRGHTRHICTDML